LGSACVSRAGERVLAIVNFPLDLSQHRWLHLRKDCFGATPKPAHATHALPKRVQLDVADLDLQRFSRETWENIRSTK
jgi:hypothetical protein